MHLPPACAAAAAPPDRPPLDAAPPGRRPHSSPTYRRTLARTAAAVLVASLGMALASLPTATSARAAEAILSPGDAVVTGFSGIRPSGAPPAPGGNLLDGFFINLDGTSAQIQSLGLMGEAPQGQLVSPGVRKQFFARDIGQVFPIALDDGNGAKVPNIYLGATSQFGLHIVKPDVNGDGAPDRTKAGAPGATWMPGMFADDKGGSPGAIWRVDGKTGAVTLFATIPDNAGPGLGDVVYDKATKQFFVSDLDTGLVHRLDANGQLIDTFDHGVTGRPAKGLGPVADDGKKADITSPALDIEKPDTWGYTQAERRVHGMAVRDGRLYYAVDKQVWSVGISGSGGFSADARWELDVDTTAPDTQLSDMLFDGTGRMYVAERAAQRGSYDYSLFAEAEKAEVKRYRLETPDDPATPSRWVEVAEAYAIGLPAEHRHSNGGITLGFPYDDTGMLKTGSCGEFLWTTGERLRAGEFAQGDAEGDPAANADVHGLQGNPVDLVRPQNVPPMTTYFTDYDQFFGDAEKAGHMGDVEIWQPCEGVPQQTGELPPWWVPPGDGIPPDYPPEFPPPETPFHTNLELQKWANPRSCFSWGSHWVCRYRIRIRNTGPEDYFGDITIRDTFPANPAGLQTFFEPQPPWSCWHPGGSPAETRCWRPDVFLPAGHSIFMTVHAVVPKAAHLCRLANIAEIEWAPGGTQWNTNPLDDIDDGVARIPDPRCRPNGDRTDLQPFKEPIRCLVQSDEVSCAFLVSVQNNGPGIFEGPITVRDEMPAGIQVDPVPSPDWTCINNADNQIDCTTTPFGTFPMAPGDRVWLTVWGTMPLQEARRHSCRMSNDVFITNPIGAPQNTNSGNNAANAVAMLPAELCPREPVAQSCPPGYRLEADRCVEKRQPPGPGIIDPPPPPPPPPPPVDVDCPRGWDEVSSTRAHFLRSEGWRVRRLPGLWCVQPPPERPCPVGTEEIPGSRVDILRERGWRISRIERGKWCGTPPPIIDCPRHLRPVSSSRVPYLRQNLWTLIRLRNGQWCGKPPIIKPECKWPLVGKYPDCRKPPVETCPHNMREVSRREASQLRRRGAPVTQLKSGQWCAGEPPVRECKYPLVGKYPDCRRPDDGGTKCWNGQIVRHQRQCPPEPCGRGFTGYKPNCKPIRDPAEECKQKGGTWRHGTCVIREVTCPDGSKAPSKSQCPPRRDEAAECKKSGGHWNGKRCERGVRCPDGSMAPSRRQCPQPTRKCPDGSVVPLGKQCPVVRKPCPPGTIGKYEPNCRKEEVRKPCPPGTVGKYQPHCRKVEVRKPCPPGTIGRFQPNCRQIVKPPKVDIKPPKREVKPPKREVKPVRRPCPPGTVGAFQPNCRVIQKRPDRPIQRPGQKPVIR